MPGARSSAGLRSAGTPTLTKTLPTAPVVPVSPVMSSTPVPGPPLVTTTTPTMPSSPPRRPVNRPPGFPAPWSTAWFAPFFAPPPIVIDRPAPVACQEAAASYAASMGLFADGCTVGHPAGAQPRLDLAGSAAAKYGVTYTLRTAGRSIWVDFALIPRQPANGPDYRGPQDFGFVTAGRSPQPFIAAGQTKLPFVTAGQSRLPFAVESYGGPSVLETLSAARLGVDQIAAARLILRSFILAGYPVGIGLAAIVNAKAESNLDSRAVAFEPRGGTSVGLFQLYDRGAGASLALPVGPTGQPDPRDPRFDPNKNTARIIEEVKRYGAGLQAAYDGGASVATLTGIFARDIERPSNAMAKAAEREAVARQLLGPIADLPGVTFGRGWTLLPALLPWYVPLAAGTIFSVLSLGLLIGLRRPRAQR